MNALRTKPFRVALVFAILASVTLLFAITAGAIGPRTLTAKRIVDVLEQRDGVHPSFRRAHAKGACFTGHFESNGRGARLSKAVIFAPGTSDVVGRFSLAGGNP